MNSKADETAGFFSVTVPPECSGLRLDVFLNRLVEFIPSRSFAQKLIECDAVQINGHRRRPSWHVDAGDLVLIDESALRPPPASPAPQKMKLDIVFEDEHILVINKPAGLVVHPGAGVPDGTLVNAVLAHTGGTLPSLGDALRAGIVHRLDRDTSGVMVVAKSQIALTELSSQFAAHRQVRRYRALIFGVPDKRQADVETWHGRDPLHRLKYAVLSEGQGKVAKMHVRVDEVLAGGLAAAVSCHLYTGRTHQIRVQLAHLRHGILGDSLYGQGAQGGSAAAAPLMREKQLWARVRELAQRQMLHAGLLGLTHPFSGEQMTFEVEPPEDFRNLEFLLKNWPT